MATFFKIAWRNVLRNKYRSLITASSIAIGFASLVFIRAFVDGSHYQMVENYTDLLSGHIQVHKKGFNENMGIRLSITDPGAVAAVLKSNPQVKVFTERVKDYALISSAEQSSGILLMGVDPVKEKQVSTLYKKIRDGEFISDDKDIVIGKAMAKTLNVTIGDKVVIMTQGFDGSLASDAYRVSGLLDTGSDEIDKGIALITLKAAQDLFVLGNSISEFTVKVASHEEVDGVAAQLRKELSSGDYEVLTWKQLSPILVQWIEFDVAFINLLLAIVLLVVAAGILNTLLMGILERVREFGIMMAIGTKRFQVTLMVFFESLVLGMLGLAAGYVIGVGLSSYFAVKGIDLANFSTALNSYYTGSVIYTKLYAGPLVFYGLSVFLTSVLVSIYPAWRASSLKPVEALRHI